MDSSVLVKVVTDSSRNRLFVMLLIEDRKSHEEKEERVERRYICNVTARLIMNGTKRKSFDEASELRKALLDAVDDGLLAFGESVRSVMYHHVE